MAQVERSTSSGGKRYITSKAVVFDDVEAKNIIVGGRDNISGLIQVLNENGNLMVNIDKAGVTLENGAEIIGGNGILTNLQYKSSSDALGYRQISLEGIGLFKGYLPIECFVPNDLTIKEAYITVTAFKTLNQFLYPIGGGEITNEYGKITNIRGYKINAGTEYINSTNFGLFGFDAPSGVEISACFGVSGYTNPTTSEATFTSIDIKSSLANGINKFYIATADSVPDNETNAGTLLAAQKSQIAVATINIVGYSK